MTKTVVAQITDVLILDETSAAKPLVLIFGAEFDTRFLLKTLLEIWNYQTVEAETAAEAFEMVVRRQPNLILMDVAAPFPECMSVVRGWRKNKIFENVPLVLLSAHAPPQYREAALQIGADDFLVKPLDFDRLEQSLAQNIRRIAPQ